YPHPLFSPKYFDAQSHISQRATQQSSPPNIDQEKRSTNMRPIADANIQIDLEGLQMVFVDENSEKCTVGVLSDTPQGHPFKISIQKQDANGAPAPFAV